jgi:hypothetical protein
MQSWPATVALAALLGPLQCGEEAVPAEQPRKWQIAVIHPVEQACMDTPQPADAVIERKWPLELATWEDVACDTLSLRVMNAADEPVFIWDEPIRWAVDDDRLHAEPVPEHGSGRTRTERSPACCDGGGHMLEASGRWAELSPGATRRWTVSLRGLEMSDTRVLCTSEVPDWFEQSVEFDELDVTVRVAFASEGSTPGQLLGGLRHPRPEKIQAHLALTRSVPIYPFRARWSLEPERD